MKKDEDVYLGAYWKNRCITAREFIKLCYEFLARLRDFSPAFDHRCVAVGEFPNVVPVNVPKDYPSFEQLMIKAVPNPKHAYTNPDPTNREFTLGSTIDVGFRISFSDAGKEGIQPTNLALSVAAGGCGEFTPANVVLIEIPPEYRAFWENTERAKQLMEVIVSIWQPALAMLTSSELRKALDPKRANNFPLGILTYFEDEGAGKMADGVAKIELVAGGGVFLSIDANYPWATSVDRFKECHSRLSSAGFLQWPHKRQPAAS